MTVQEAIAQIEPVAKSSRKVSGVGLFEPKPITIALEMAISLLEKQIPKKVKRYRLSSQHFGICCCGEHIEGWCGVLTPGMDVAKYCPNCGQAIEWGEEAEK